VNSLDQETTSTAAPQPARRLQNCLQQQQALPRLLVLGQSDKRLLQLRIAAKALRPSHQPQIELVFHTAQLALQLRRIPLWIIYQITGVHLEKCGKNLPRGVGQVRTSPALDLREIALADRGAGFSLNGPHHLLLIDRPLQAAQTALDLA